MKGHRFFQGLPHGLSRIQGSVWVLEDHLHAGPVGEHPLGGQVVDALPTVKDFPAVRRIKAHGGSGQGRLAAAAFTHHGKNLTGGNGKADVVDRLDRGSDTLQAAVFQPKLIEQAAGDIEVFDDVLQRQ